MRAAPCREYDFAAAARQLNLSYSHFRRLFRQQQQRAPHDFLLHARMALAARELEDPARQVKDVAAACGYPDPARFSKLFRAKIGLSPQLYRLAVFRNAGVRSGE
jgi:AraC-like DNA-binding protein